MVLEQRRKELMEASSSAIYVEWISQEVSGLGYHRPGLEVVDRRSEFQIKEPHQTEADRSAVDWGLDISDGAFRDWGTGEVVEVEIRDDLLGDEFGRPVERKSMMDVIEGFVVVACYV